MKRLRREMARLNQATQAHSTSPVPEGQSVASWRVALVCIGIAFTLTGLYTGSELAASLGLALGVRAVVIGSLLLTVMSVPAALMGARTRLSTYMIVRHVFGGHGAKVINLVLAIVLIGWYAVTAELFGRTCYLTVGPLVPTLAWPQWVYTVGCSGLVMLTAMFGFHAIERLSLWVAPLLVLLTAWVAWRSLAHVSWPALLALRGTAPDLGTGISAVIGGMIVNVVVMPDITRYSRSLFDCALISVAGNGLGGGVALVLAMIPALAFGEADPMKYMATLGLVGIAFTTLVLSTWAINAVNLYSTGLVAATVLRRTSHGRIVVACGTFGTGCALLGLADNLIDFLVLLGLAVPPIAAVYLTDFFVLRRTVYPPLTADDSATAFKPNALLACFAAGGIGIWMYFSHRSLTGVPTIESFLCAGLLYALAEGVRMRHGRSGLRPPAESADARCIDEARG